MEAFEHHLGIIVTSFPVPSKPHQTAFKTELGNHMLAISRDLLIPANATVEF